MALLAGCTTGMQDPSTVEEEQQGLACIDLEGQRFESLGEGECGLGPTGPVFCKWSIAFTARDELSTDYEWSYSDVADGGRVTCDGNLISTMPVRVGVDGTRGTYDPDSQELTWENVTYTLVAP